MEVAGKTFIYREGATVNDTDGSACSFTSGGVTFYGMYADNNRIFYAIDAGMSNYLTVRDGMGDWEEEAYKQITFADDEEPFSGNFATWFDAVYEVYMNIDVSNKRYKGKSSFTLTETDGSGCTFTSQGTTFQGMYSSTTEIYYVTDILQDTKITVFRNGSWLTIDGKKYDVIEFGSEEPFSGPFAEWFESVFEWTPNMKNRKFRFTGPPAINIYFDVGGGDSRVTFYSKANPNGTAYQTLFGLPNQIEFRYGTPPTTIRVYSSGTWLDDGYKVIKFGPDDQFTGEWNYNQFMACVEEIFDEQADYTTKAASLTAVADAIRAKGGTSAALTYPDGFVNAINNIQTGVEWFGYAKDSQHYSEEV